MKFFKIITIFSVFAFPVSIAHAKNEEPYRYELNTEFLAKTNRQIEKELPILERQVELLIKMISNDKYRAKIQNELSEVLIGYDSTYYNYDPEKRKKPYHLLGTAKNESEWKRGQKLSFLAKVLKEYKAPLSKTCIGINYRGEKKVSNQDIYQPLNWHFPIAYLSGQMFTKKPIDQLGFGGVDLLSLSEPELIRMANLSNKIVDLQIVLRDGFEGKLNLDVLQQYVSFAHAKKIYKYKYMVPFGIEAKFRSYENKPCDIFRGNGKLAASFWPVIGYEMILPTEIIPEKQYFDLSRNDYSTGGGILESDLEKFPPEYVDAWKNLAYFYNDYYPDLKANFPIEMYDKILTAKAEEPLGDLMSGENDGSNSTIEDDELALPSLE